MSWRRFAVAGLLCALPAHGADSRLSESVVGVLTPVDSVPSPEVLDRVFAPDPALDRLSQLALDDSIDLGIQLRAIRALPAYCPQAVRCGPGTAVHDTLVVLLDRYTVAPDDPQTPKDMLRLQAAIEALGETRADLVEDLDRLLGLLATGRASTEPGCARRRDIRVAAARAIGKFCIRAAANAIRPYQSDACGQVAHHVGEAVRALEQCAQ